MKHSDILTKNGVIYNPITDIMAKARLARKETILVICNDNEIFDEAMKTLATRFPKASGLVLAPNPGVVAGKKNTTVRIYDDHAGINFTIDIMTAAEYEINKLEVDAKQYAVKETIMFTGGMN